MTIHEKQHNGYTDKVHNCSFCDSAFSRKYKLREHMDKSHGAIIPHNTIGNGLREFKPKMK